jgi:lysyl-tRNA synthetase class 2
LAESVSDRIDAIEGRFTARRSVHTTRVMPHVRSSMMTFVKYDDEARELDVTFTSGKTYRYREVPVEIYDGLLESESKGEFFNDNIKDVFAYSEVRSRRKP